MMLMIMILILIMILHIMTMTDFNGNDLSPNPTSVGFDVDEFWADPVATGGRHEDTTLELLRHLPDHERVQLVSICAQSISRTISDHSLTNEPAHRRLRMTEDVDRQHGRSVTLEKDRTSGIIGQEFDRRSICRKTLVFVSWNRHWSRCSGRRNEYRTDPTSIASNERMPRDDLQQFEKKHCLLIVIIVWIRIPIAWYNQDNHYDLSIVILS